jgi:putative DNA methylase
MQKTTTTLTPLALKDAPALIETVFPAQKVSFEAQSERKAGAAQTLTGLGSYWKGRKPLILVRAIVLASLLPPTTMRRQISPSLKNSWPSTTRAWRGARWRPMHISATSLQEMIPISDPERYFGGRGWRRDITDDDKLMLYRQALATLSKLRRKGQCWQAPGRGGSRLALRSSVAGDQSPLCPLGRLR